MFAIDYQFLGSTSSRVPTSLPTLSCLLSPTQSTADAWACLVTLPVWIPALQPMMHSTVPSMERHGTHPPARRSPPHVDSTNQQRFNIVSSPRMDPRHSSGSCDEIGATGLCYPSVLKEGRLPDQLIHWLTDKVVGPGKINALGHFIRPAQLLDEPRALNERQQLAGGVVRRRKVVVEHVSGADADRRPGQTRFPVVVLVRVIKVEAWRVSHYHLTD